MHRARAVGLLSMGIGAALMGIAGFADELGLGATPDVLGAFQWIGISVGSTLFILGLGVYLWTTD